MTVGPRRVLVADDDPEMLLLVRRILELEHFDVSCVATGRDAISAVSRNEYDLVILDVTMPAVSGLAVCAAIRERHSVPVIMLTARNSDGDIVKGFEAGADDYITKPFSSPALIARIDAILRRINPAAVPSNLVYTYEDLVLNVQAKTLTKARQPIPLSPTEFRLFTYLAHNAGRVLTVPQMIEDVWGFERTEDKRLAQTVIASLRRKLGDDANNSRYIMTHHGVGYSIPRP